MSLLFVFKSSDIYSYGRDLLEAAKLEEWKPLILAMLNQDPDQRPTMAVVLATIKFSFS